MTGQITTYAHFPDGHVEVVEDGYNLVVNSAYVAMAAAIKDGSALFFEWAIGDGAAADSSTWDAGIEDSTLSPVGSDTALLGETFRKAIAPTDIVYLDSLGAVSVTPTNRLQITITFEESEPGDAVAYLREWGIFNEDGLLINHRFHKTYEKTNAVKLERVLRFQF